MLRGGRAPQDKHKCMRQQQQMTRLFCFGLFIHKAHLQLHEPESCCLNASLAGHKVKLLQQHSVHLCVYVYGVVVVVVVWAHQVQQNSRRS